MYPQWYQTNLTRVKKQVQIGNQLSKMDKFKVSFKMEENQTASFVNTQSNEGKKLLELILNTCEVS